MSHPAPGEVRVKFVRRYPNTMPDLYQVWLEPEGTYLGIVERAVGWRAYLPDKVSPVPDVFFATRREAGDHLRSLILQTTEGR